MNRIQKAEEFAMVALDIYSDEVLPRDKHEINILTNLIRVRDRAIIERCREAIENNRPWGIEEDGSKWRGGFISDAGISRGLDSVLYELDGGGV